MQPSSVNGFRLEFRWYRDSLFQFLEKIYSNYDLIA